MTISAKAKMKYLSVAEMQMVEIAKAISNDAKSDHHGRAKRLRFLKRKWQDFSR